MARRSKRNDTSNTAIAQRRDEEARQRINEHLQELESTNTTRRQALAAKTAKSREALWEASVMYFRDIAYIDPEQVWLDLCQDDRKAEAYCKAFLEHYLLESENRRLVFGPQESELTLTITCAVTMEEVWKSLIAEVDHRILSNKRSEDRKNKYQWILKSPQLEKDPLGIFPSSRVRMWILNDLAPKYGLSFEQTFVKRAATADDLLRILDAIWTRAADIPCSPQTRYSFDWVVALLGLCGARPCELMDMTYDNVELAMVRNPTDPTKAVPVATILLQHRKQKTNTVKGAQNDNRVRFKVTIVPCKNVCLTRKIIGQALTDDAFEAGYRSYDELVMSPDLEDVDYIPLKWRSDFSGKVMFPIKYSTFLAVWKATQRVLGMREFLKPYAARVGAGININGVFAPAVRNYVLGNTSLVYEKSYVPQAVSGSDLMKAAWNALAGTDEVTPQLRHATHSRDENAPIWPTCQDIEAIDSRQDVQKLRAEYDALKEEHGRNSSEARDAKRRLDSHVSALRKLAVSKQREEYFAHADQLRSLGKSTAPLRNAAIPARPSNRYGRSVSDAIRIGQLMRQDGLQDDEFEIEYFESIVSFLQNRHTSKEAKTDEKDWTGGVS
ncbi:hypothetical protein CGCFRS4_v015943 [Colletotrichum fructicola]|nr:hypothetical protein CGCFRS4_v015943 [Colletotrichum fructicola]